MTPFARLCRATPARLGVGRAGSRPRTATLLAFRRDHAAARDAVWSAWSPAFLEWLSARGFLCVRSAAPDRRAYVLTPPLGRQLAAGEVARIRAANAAAVRGDTAGPSVQLVLSDGLSAIAAERHAEVIVPRLLEGLRRLGPVCVPVAVHNGRVAVGDAVASASAAGCVVHLIGERPGLGSADSLGCYLTYRPGALTTDADRKCISNIHAAGLNPAEAAATIIGTVRRILAAGTSGMDLIL
jgi:ethanolamine ammonia-lyase small subunit